MSRDTHEELVHFLSDMYSVEQQALAQLISAPDIAGHPTLAADFREHHAQTEQQAALVRERLEARGGSPSAIKDAVMKLGGKGFLLFARVMPETPGRLAAHAYSYEAMEWAGYEMLIRIAAHAGDSETVEVGRAIAAQERAMMQRLARGFDVAEEASHRKVAIQKMGEHVCRHLAEAHALEAQSIELLKKGEKIAGGAQLEEIYRQHLDETRGQARLLEERLDALGEGPSTIKDTALKVGAINWGLFFQGQSDTPAKLAAFAYAFEHLEIGGYELLRRSARRAQDAETERLCERILAEERVMAERLANAFDGAVEATLEAVRT